MLFFIREGLSANPALRWRASISKSRLWCRCDSVKNLKAAVQGIVQILPPQPIFQALSLDFVNYLLS